jgi:hypothetical protein
MYAAPRSTVEADIVRDGAAPACRAVTANEELMNRRDFLGAIAASSLTGADAAQGPASKKPGCYVMHHYRLQLGSQGTRLSDFLSKTYLPAVARAQGGPSLVLEAQVSEHLPLVTVIDAFASVDQVWSLQAKLRADKAFQDGTDAWQAGPDRPFESLTTELLEAPDFAPEFTPLNPPPKSPRVFEMRVYQTHTTKELRGLVERFAEAEVKILTRAGSQPMMFGTTLFGNDRPNLTWMLAFDDMGAREKFSAAFSADPEWIALRKQSLERYGQMPSYRRLSLHRPAAYSKIL